VLVATTDGAICAPMLNILSVLIGLLVLLLGLPAFLPFLGWVYWLVLPIAVVGAALGALSRHNGGRNLNLVLLLIFGARWALGGFVF
jgi:hypothetical protein